MNKMHLRILVLIFSIGCLNSSFGQKDYLVITGKAISKWNSKPLENVKIVVAFQDKMTQTVMTDRKGKYTIKIKKCDCTVSLFSETSKNTSDGTTQGNFLACNQVSIIDVQKQDTFKYNFFITEAVD